MFSIRQKFSSLTCGAVVFLLAGLVSPLLADEVIRIMAANLSSGTTQDYDGGEGNRIFRGLDPDIALVQEMNYLNNTATNFRSWVDTNFGTTFSYVRELSPGNIPNGIVSRYPILASGEWDDSTLTDRDFMWAKIDIPGDKDLWVISVHLKASSDSTSQRNTQAGAILNYISAQKIPAADYMVIGGDFNTYSRTESCITTLSAEFVTTGPWPVDQTGDGDTNSGRSEPYDWVIADAELHARKTPLVVGASSFTNGLVFDSRVYSPLPSPVLSADSGATGMQHMAVIRAFNIPTNTAPTIASAANSSSVETVTDPDSSVYEIVRGTSVGLSVLAADDGGEAALKYTWSLTSGPGSSVTFSANGTNAAKNGTATFQALGSYTLTATAQDVAGLGVSSSVKVRVVQAAGSLALNPPAATLAVGATQAFSASLLDQFGQAMASQPVFSWSVGGGGNVGASGIFTATTAGGPYVLTASGSGFSDTSGVTVTRGAAGVSLGNLTQTYNGSQKTATATTTPSGLAVTWLYNGSATPPTNAGSYPVIATIADPNYTGSASGTLVVQKAGASLVITGTTATYDGSPKPVTISPSNIAVAVLYNGSSTIPSNAGSYTVAVSVTDPNHTGSAGGTLVIQKAAATLELTGLTTAYDGNPKPAGFATTPSNLAVTLLYNGSPTAPTDAGIYPVTATITDPNHAGSSAGTLVIQKNNAVLQLTDLTAIYDGSPKSATSTTTPSGLAVTILYGNSSAPPTTVGSYAVTATINDANHSGGATGTLVIQKAEAALEITGLTATYDGNPKPVTASSNPTSLAVSILYDGSPEPPVNPGSYAVTASVIDANYQGSSTSTLVIVPDEWALWKNTKFTAQEQIDGLAADSADPDADGSCNLIEYALGSDPRQFTAPIPGVMDDVGISLTFTRPAALPGIHYTVEASSDFASWTSVPLEILETGPVETVRAREPFGPDPSVPRFLRLRVGRD